MLQNWLSPISEELVNECQSLATHQIGKSLQIYDNNFPDLKKVSVVLLGIDGDKTIDLRRQFYRLSNSFEGLGMADIGNVRKANYSFVIPIIKELLQSSIFPIILGSDISLAKSQFSAYLEIEELVNVVSVERVFNHFSSSTCYTEILEKHRAKLFNLGVIGVQAPFVNPQTLKYFRKQSFDMIRIGQLRSHMESLEPVIRDADMVTFNLSSIRSSDAPGQMHPIPSGFSLEEACQIARYAGMSDKLTSFGIFGLDIEKDQTGQTSALYAQLIWYLVDGFNNRKNDFPASVDALVEYVVDNKDGAPAMTFWKSKKTGRWWIQAPEKGSNARKRHSMIPCSYEDFKQSCSFDIPDRIINAFGRFAH